MGSPAPSAARGGRASSASEAGRAERLSLDQIVAGRLFSRATETPLVGGNRVRLLRDAAENYPAWLDAIAAARRAVLFESYILHEDEVGRRFADLLAAKAREGVRVRLLYDWVGALGHASRRFWAALRRAEVEVRCFNRPRLDSPFGWLSRDHRKMIAVDGRIGFVTGLCVGQRWVGDPARGIAPWRDTGIALQGPAVADLEQAFAETWALAGAPLPPAELTRPDSIPAAGDTRLRVIANAPSMARLYRLDLLVAAGARQSLWLTDAYFVAVPPYVQALCAAARDGLDVRLLVPGASDVQLVSHLSRVGYRPLLEAGVRVFEWNGPMLHAKTAVADGRWARVGSSNLNLASWLGNWELDVAVEDVGFAGAMEAMYREDLGHATEIVLAGRRVRPADSAEHRPSRRGSRYGSAGRVAAGAIGLGSAVGAAVSSRRALGPAEATVMAAAAVMLLLIAALGIVWPRALAFPLAAACAWIGVALLVGAYRIRRGPAESRDSASRDAGR